MKHNPKIETYGVVPKKKVEEITKKFDWKRWRVQIILLVVLGIGSLFNLMSQESDNRYEDLKVNEEQKIVENQGELVGLSSTIEGMLSIFPIIIIIVVLISIILTFFGRRR